MSLVWNESISDRRITVGAREVYFDGWGFCEALNAAETALLLTIPGFLLPDPSQVAEREALRAYAAGDGAEGEDALAEIRLAADQAEALEEEPEEPAVESHEPWKLAPEQAIEQWAALNLEERLHQATDGAFSRKQLVQLFEVEQRGRRSKRVLTALEQSIRRVTPARGAAAINRALVQASTPVVRES